MGQPRRGGGVEVTAQPGDRVVGAAGEGGGAEADDEERGGAVR